MFVRDVRQKLTTAGLFCAALLLGASQASADTLNFHFDDDVRYRQHVGVIDGTSFQYLSKHIANADESGTIDVTYDTDTHDLLLTLDSIGHIDTTVPDLFDATASITLFFDEVIQIDSPEGLLAFAAIDGSQGITLDVMASITVDGDLTDGTYFDDDGIDQTETLIEYHAVTMDAFWAGFEVLGSNHLFLLNIDDILGLKSWTMSNGEVFVNGLASDQINTVKGDIHANQPIPEPATAALLGMGLLGGMLRRKKKNA